MGKAPLRVAADADRCVGAGQCVLSAPRVFDQSDEGTVVVLDTSPSGADAAAAGTAAGLCPARAISVRRD